MTERRHDRDRAQQHVDVGEELGPTLTHLTAAPVQHIPCSMAESAPAAARCRVLTVAVGDLGRRRDQDRPLTSRYHRVDVRSAIVVDPGTCALQRNDCSFHHIAHRAIDWREPVVEPCGDPEVGEFGGASGWEVEPPRSCVVRIRVGEQSEQQFEVVDAASDRAEHVDVGDVAV